MVREVPGLLQVGAMWVLPVSVPGHLWGSEGVSACGDGLWVMSRRRLPSLRVSWTVSHRRLGTCRWAWVRVVGSSGLLAVVSPAEYS